MAIYDNIKWYHLQCPKKVPRAFFMVAKLALPQTQVKKQLEKPGFG
jgi:hypothetical protein